MAFSFPSGVSATQSSDISFLNGLNPDGTLATTSFYAWDGNTPATYSAATAYAHKWGDATVGTGATISYYFDTGSNWTAAEQATFLGAMALYADIANVTFTQAASEADAAQSGLVFYRYGSMTAAANGVTLATGYYEDDSDSGGGIESFTSAYISAQTQNTAYGDITSFSTFGGYGIDSIVHEMGHAVGLGHAGPYNGTANPKTQQFDAVDTRLYSIMSYINPNDTTAEDYKDYPVTGTNWGKTTDGYQRAPYTPMIDDILAVQQLYGVSSGTTLNKTQTFGFNTTIAASDPIRMFYDFTIDTAPVLTIYDSAPGNTLDLSGYGANSTVDLNPGTFSSVAGLVNNIGIAFGTAIDVVIGGSGADTFIVNADADAIDGGGGTNTVDFSGVFAAYSVVKVGVVVDVTDLANSVTDALTNIATLKFSDQSVATSSIACFVRGTRILTARGAVEVQALTRDDCVVAASGALRPIRWIGHRRLDLSRHPLPQAVTPVRVRAGAFGEGLPFRDLWISPEHGLACGEILIPAGVLINGVSITQTTTDSVEYWHVELDAHDILFAEGFPAESYLDTGNRTDFVGGGAFIAAHPDFAPKHWAETCLPVKKHGREVAGVKAWLIAGIIEAGCRIDRDADAHILVDGLRVEPIRVSDTRLAFVLPPGGREIVLRSRTFVPSHVIADSDDARTLGLCVGRLQVDGASFAWDDAAWEDAASGWGRAEFAGGRFSHRWTDGAAWLPAGVRMVVVDLAGRGRYWRRPARSTDAHRPETGRAG